MIKDFFKKIWNKKENTTEKNEILSFINDFVVAFIMFLFLSTFLYQGFSIPSGSMKPQLVEGDCIMVSKFAYGYSKFSFPFFKIPFVKGRIMDFKKPQRGDVVVFRLPSDTSINYIKRLIGVPGDRVQLKNRILYINDVPLERKYLENYMENGIRELSVFEENINNKKIKVLQDMENYNFVANDTVEYVIPAGEYFFMGDNRDNSLDSRFIETGSVPYENIVGKAKIIFFSKNDNMFKFWKWHKTIQFKRFFTLIK